MFHPNTSNQSTTTVSANLAAWLHDRLKTHELDAGLTDPGGSSAPLLQDTACGFRFLLPTLEVKVLDEEKGERALPLQGSMTDRKCSCVTKFIPIPFAPQSHHMQRKHNMITSKIRSREVTPFPLFFPTFWFYGTAASGSVTQIWQWPASVALTTMSPLNSQHYCVYPD